jgi:hypothetical protein
MSYISTLAGELWYSVEEDFIEALEVIGEGGWTDQVDLVTTEGELTEDEVGGIKIPFGVYRNLGRNLDILLDLARGGYVIGTSSDVRWHGFFVKPDGTDESYDLDEWITNNHLKLADQKPLKVDFKDESEWFDEYVDWQADCENKFRCVVGPQNTR